MLEESAHKQTKLLDLANPKMKTVNVPSPRTLPGQNTILIQLNNNIIKAYIKISLNVSFKTKVDVPLLRY